MTKRKVDSIYEIDDVPYKKELCSTCEKEFNMFPNWIYWWRDEVYCSYKCMPNHKILYPPMHTVLKEK